MYSTAAGPPSSAQAATLGSDWLLTVRWMRSRSSWGPAGPSSPTVVPAPKRSPKAPPPPAAWAAACVTSPTSNRGASPPKSGICATRSWTGYVTTGRFCCNFSRVVTRM